MPHRKKIVDDHLEDMAKKSTGHNEMSEREILHLSLTSDSFTSDVQLTTELAVTADFPADGTAMVECFHCHKMFTSAVDIQRHMLEKHMPIQTKPLTNEQAVMSEANDYNSHHELSVRQPQKRKTQAEQPVAENRARYRCDICIFSSFSPAALTVHRKTHVDPQRESWYKCHLCDFSAKQYADLTQHGETNHRLESGEFACTYCPKTFENYAKARRHVWQTHIDMNVVCQECGKKFIRMDRLRKHAASAHSDTPAGHCLRCGKAFRRKDKLKDHEEVCMDVSSGHHTNSHHKKTPNNQTEQVRPPKRRPGPKCVVSKLEPQPDDAYVRFPFRCDICRVGFKKHSALLIHAEARHHDQIIPVVLPMVDLNHQMVQEQTASVPGQQYSCPHCQVSWATLMEKKLHVSLDHPVQKDDNPSFECPFCLPGLGRNYPVRERLVRHLRRQHRQLLTPLLRNNSSTYDQDVANHVEIGQQRPSLLSRKASSAFNTSILNSVTNSNLTAPIMASSEMSQSSSQFMSPLPVVAFQQMDCGNQMAHSSPVHMDGSSYAGVVVHHADGVCDATSPNFFSCGSLTDLSALSVPEAPYATEHHHLSAMSPVAVTHNQGCQVHHHHHHQQQQPAVYDTTSLVCFADPISSLVGQGPDESSAADASYILAASPLPLSTSVLAACFDSPLTGPLNSHAYQLLE